MSCEAGDGVMGFRPEEPQVTLLHQAQIALHYRYSAREEDNLSDRHP